MTINIQQNISLKGYTTMKVGGIASHFTIVKSINDVADVIEYAKANQLKIFVLGGGSNLIVKDSGFAGLVIKNEILGFDTVKETSIFVTVKVGAGEVLDSIIDRFVKLNYYGIENLSLVPGSVGASAVQNISAYGQEVSSVIKSIDAVELDSGKVVELNAQECGFSYRRSIFNEYAKGKYLITGITFELVKSGAVDIKYKDFRRYFGEKDKPSLEAVRDAVISIRNSKLPLIDEVGSAGSFFKSVNLLKTEYDKFLLKIAKTLSKEKQQRIIDNIWKSESLVKIPTGLLIDVLELKSMSVNSARIYKKHALILINSDGSATADDILTLAGNLKSAVKKYTGLDLEQEPEILG